MNVKSLFLQGEKIDIESYLSKCGVENPSSYLKGQTVESTQNYYNIDEYCLGMKWCLESDEPFYLLVDSDMDGYLSSSLFYTYCKLVNPNCNLIPIFHNKYIKAHGLDDKEVMDYLKSVKSSYLFINDAGTNDVEYCKELSDLGWVVIISDHHMRTKENNYCVLINNQISENVANKGLSGTGVVWKCLKRFDEIYGFNYARSLISYVMCSIISDSMSLLYEENYSFIRWGKKLLHKNLQPFVENLNKGNTNKDYSFGFIVGGNSLIRMGNLNDKQNFFYALCGENDEIESLISRMNYLHTKQSNNVKSLLENHITEIYKGKIGIYHIDVVTPLTGLIAGRLCGQLNIPILLVNEKENGTYMGSCRSNIPLKDMLNESGLFVFNEGHLDSFGTCYNVDKEQEIIDFIENAKLPEPCYEVTLSSTINSIPNSLFELSEQGSYLFGKDIPIPKIHVKFTINTKDIYVIGKNKTTIKFKKNDIEFIKFFCSKEYQDKLEIGKNKLMSAEIIGTLDINEWNGQMTNQIIIEEIELKEKNLEDFI